MSRISPSSRRNPENKNNNVNDIIPVAKRNFLTATEKIVSQISPEATGWA